MASTGVEDSVTEYYLEYVYTKDGCRPYQHDTVSLEAAQEVGKYLVENGCSGVAIYRRIEIDIDFMDLDKHGDLTVGYDWNSIWVETIFPKTGE